jgi:hypothetical protein
MNRNGSHFWGYAGRFVLLHLAAYTVIGGIFLYVQSLVPETRRVALDFEYFSPYRVPGLVSLAAQASRGFILALIFYPFYTTITSSRRGGLALFGAMWGVAVFGSVEPIPGSLEGMVYTITTLPEHAAVLAATAIQTALFVRLFLRWETSGVNHADRGSAHGDLAEGRTAVQSAPVSKKGHVLRFFLLHLLTYWTVGALFGPLLALLLFPFLATWVSTRHGWLLLFGLLFGLTAVGSPVFLHLGIKEAVDSTTFSQFVESWTVGLPEIFTQMLVFSILLFLWERRRLRHRPRMARAGHFVTKVI